MVWNTSLQDRDAKIVLHSSKHQAADVFQLCYLFPQMSSCHLSWNSLTKVMVAKRARELWARSSKQALRLSSEVLGLGTRRQTLWTLFLWAVGMETERQMDSDRQGSISILKPAYGRSKISIHMQMEVHLWNLCKYKKATGGKKKNTLKGKQRGVHALLFCLLLLMQIALLFLYQAFTCSNLKLSIFDK